MIENGIAAGNRLAFTQSCTYPDGTKVFCSAMLDLKSGKIVQQTVVQAWDASVPLYCQCRDCHFTRHRARALGHDGVDLQYPVLPELGRSA